MAGSRRRASRNPYMNGWYRAPGYLELIHGWRVQGSWLLPTGTWMAGSRLPASSRRANSHRSRESSVYPRCRDVEVEEKEAQAAWVRAAVASQGSIGVD